ncbi:hypothetical protein [Sphingobium cyanobacteriorum]
MAVLVAALALAGCDGDAPRAGNDATTTPAPAPPVDDGKADCITGDATDWAHDCLIERAGDRLTIRHPDGGFRRFRVLADGRGLEAADGAEPARLRIVGDRQIEVAAGDDRYRLPAQIAGQ